MIQGFHVESKKDFIALRSAIEAAYLEGWHPTAKDIEEVYKYGLDPKHLKEAKKAMVNAPLTKVRGLYLKTIE